ncbi:hypothetical protein ACTXT7_006194 [Hymenolepis weldensis]
MSKCAHRFSPRITYVLVRPYPKVATCLDILVPPLRYAQSGGLCTYVALTLYANGYIPQFQPVLAHADWRTKSSTTKPPKASHLNRQQDSEREDKTMANRVYLERTRNRAADGGRRSSMWPPPGSYMESLNNPDVQDYERQIYKAHVPNPCQIPNQE